VFDVKKDTESTATITEEAGDEVIEPRQFESDVDAMSNRSEQPSRLPETPSQSMDRANQPGDEDARKLVIGREIVLNGEINSCDLLVVEGRVEATMKECREIKITETGTFKGQVEFERADISGVFEGDLTAREHLVVRATGRVTGKVRFGELEIERGGQVIGDIQVCGAEAGHHPRGTAAKLAK
jgi:cytoskeletal protein CcmA (bactofilin family)